MNETDWRNRSLLASSANASEDQLAEFATDDEWCVRESVANNPNTSVLLLDQLASDEHWAVRCGVASNARASEKTLKTLAKDEDPSVRAAVINNPCTPKGIREIVSLNPAEWAQPLVETKTQIINESAENQASHDGFIKLRSVSVAWRLTSASQSHPCFEIRTETEMPGLMGVDIACLFMDDSAFKNRLRTWMVGTAFRHIKILDSVSDNEPGASFTAAVNKIRKLCVDQGLTSPSELKGNELVNGLVDTIASVSQRELDRRYPTRLE